MENLFKTIPTTNWWERLALKFIRKKYYGVDVGRDNRAVTTVFKQFRGKLYLVEIWETLNDK